MTIQPFFSIVIPTCNRPELLEKNLEACKLITFQDFEIIVSDNYSDPETAEVVKRAEFTKVRYYRTSERLSMPDNFDFAWSYANGKYVVFVGDDDVLLPKTLEETYEIITKHEAQIVIWNSSLFYHEDWKSSGKLHEIPAYGNILELYKTCNTGYLCQIDVNNMIRNYGKFNFLCFPNTHNFCFLKALGDEVVQKTGRLFWPLYPDYTSSLLLLGVANKDKVFWSDHNGSCGGRSFNSNIGSFYVKKHKKRKLRLAEFTEEFKEQDLMPYHPYKLFSFYNGYAAALSLARKVLPREFKSYNYDAQKLVNLIDTEFNSPALNQFVKGENSKKLFEEMQEALGMKPIALKKNKPRFHIVMYMFNKVRELLKFVKNCLVAKEPINAVLYNTPSKVQLDISKLGYKDIVKAIENFDKIYQEFAVGKTEGVIVQALQAGIIQKVIVPQVTPIK